MRGLLGILLLLAADPAESVVVPLQAGFATEECPMGYGASRPIAIETARPRFVLEAPTFAAADPLWFRAELGETRGVPFFGALDRSDGKSPHDRLHIDRNRDLDLRNDGPPIAARVRELRDTGTLLVEFLGCSLDLPYVAEGKEVAEPYRCVFFYYATGGKPSLTLEVERDGWREGVVRAGGKETRIALLDDDGDGQFTTADSWAAGSEVKALLGRDATRTMTHPCWSADGAWTFRVTSVDAAGRTLKVDVVKAAEAEKEYWLRVLRARQSDEERKLEIDPMRPKADPKERIDWLAGNPLDRGLEIADRVKKRLLVEVMGPRCEWCIRMERFTFRDREVVSLAERFVAQRIVFNPADDDCRRLGAEGTPTYVILEADGREVSRRAGFQKPQDFAAWLKSALR